MMVTRLPAFKVFEKDRVIGDRFHSSRVGFPEDLGFLPCLNSNRTTGEFV